MTLPARLPLARYVGQRLGFEGIVSRHGTRPNEVYEPVRTLALSPVIAGSIVLDHAWIDTTPEIDALSVQPGDVLFFTARVTRYPKGYQLSEVEYLWSQ